MSRRGNCWDNAPVESFFGTLKQELVNHSPFATRAAARKDVFEYIEVWYNRQRRHSSLCYVSPARCSRREAYRQPLLNRVSAKDGKGHFTTRCGKHWQRWETDSLLDFPSS
jgi:putative transposase